MKKAKRPKFDILCLVLFIFAIIYATWLFYFSTASPTDKREITISVSVFGTFLITLYGVVAGLKEFKLKFGAEIRLAESARAEIDTKLMESFLKLLPVLESRKTGFLSEKIVEDITKNNAEYRNYIDKIKLHHIQDGKSDPEIRSIQLLLSTLSIVNQPSGAAEQAGCIQALYELAKNHKILREPCVVVLNKWKDTSYAEQVIKLMALLGNNEESEKDVNKKIPCD